jgi:hypothetical protein
MEPALTIFFQNEIRRHDIFPSILENLWLPLDFSSLKNNFLGNLLNKKNERHASCVSFFFLPFIYFYPVHQVARNNYKNRTLEKKKEKSKKGGKLYFYSRPLH